MRGKLLFVAGAAVGYVLGARAGRKRYEQIKSAASKVWESPGVQKQVDQVEDFVAAKVGDIPGALYEGAKKLIVQASNRRSETNRRDASRPSAASTSGSTALIPKPSATDVQPAAPKQAAKKPAAKTAASKPAASKPAASKTAAAKPAAAKPSTRSAPAKKPASSTGDTDA